MLQVRWYGRTLGLIGVICEGVREKVAYTDVPTSKNYKNTDVKAELPNYLDFFRLCVGIIKECMVNLISSF